jgi:hypothetical protein
VRDDDADSWELSTIFGNATLHAALFLRDAFHLKPEDEDLLPPRLTGDVPNLSSLVPGFDPYDAGLAWSKWWEEVVEYEGAVALGEFRGSHGEDNLRAMSSARAQVFDPPGFESMDETPSLRSLARAAHREALQWSKFHSSRSDTATQRATRSSVVSRIVWETCVSLHVTPTQLSATVLVLEVDGSWRSFPRPGLMLCSANIVRKETHFEQSLRDVFLEHLGLNDSPPMTSWPFGDFVGGAMTSAAGGAEIEEDPYFFGPSNYID